MLRHSLVTAVFAFAPVFASAQEIEPLRETVTVLEVIPAPTEDTAEEIPATPAPAAQEAQPVASAASGGLTCGTSYRIKSGDTLSGLATQVYGRASNWTLIYYANQRALGRSPSIIYPGIEIKIPCTGRDEDSAPTQANAGDDEGTTVAAAAPAPVAQVQPYRRRTESIRFLTADDYRPFTDRSLPEGGLATNVVNAAMIESGEDFSITWINDWAAHLDPLLKDQVYDMGFPWLRPPCNEMPDNFRCQTFLFSEPLFEMLITMFVKNDSDIAFETDEEIEGKRLCRPAGYFTFDLDAKGRNWLADDKITLMQPQAVNTCFEMLMRDEVDAVALNEFTGRQALSQLELADEVRTLPRAVSVEPLHVVVPKTHPRATVMLYKVNSAITKMKDDGRYQDIVSEHLARFWSEN